MRFLVVEDETITLNRMRRMLGRMYPDSDVVGVENYLELQAAEMKEFDVAFLDIELPGENGLDIAKKLLEKKPNTNIIFTTAYSEYVQDAYKLYASGYLMKPILETDIRREMEDLRFPIEENRLQIRCFGNFEVFYGDIPLHFERKGSKEMLAYLISRKGVPADRREISKALWSDVEDIDEKKNYFRILLASLRNALRACDSEEILIVRRDSYAIDPRKIDCDYYQYLDGDMDASVMNGSGFMQQYEWAKNEQI